MPSFFRFFPREKPSHLSGSTTISEMPFDPPSSPVLATVMIRSAAWPLVMKIFDPLILYWLPSFSARVRTACRSEPVEGSVMAIAPTISPDASPGSQRAFCSSVP